MSPRYYSKLEGSNHCRSHHETVKRIVADQRKNYTPNQVRRWKALCRDNERWRQHRQHRLTVELENIGNKIGREAENDEVEYLRTKQAVLIKEIEMLDLHSKYCWRRYRWRAYLKTPLYWWTYWFQSVEGQGRSTSDTVTCYCPT